VEVPKILYKYMTADTVKIVLDTNKLRWQSPCQFNDVNELQRMPILSPNLEESKLIYLKKLVDIIYNQEENNFTNYATWSQWYLVNLTLMKSCNVSDKEALEKILIITQSSPEKLEDKFRQTTESENDGSLRIFCLTEHNNDSLMWDKYGDNYKGCMFGFRHIEELGTPFRVAEKVTYSSSAPEVDGSSAVDSFLYNSRELSRNIRLAIHCNKGEEWAYEKEWRVICKSPQLNNEKHSDFLFHPQELESITFGSEILPENKQNIISIIEEKYQSCKVFEIESNKGMSERVMIKS